MLCESIRGGVSQLVELHDDKVWELDSASTNISDALAVLSEMVGGLLVKPGVNCRGIFALPQRPPMPLGDLPISQCTDAQIADQYCERETMCATHSGIGWAALNAQSSFGCYREAHSCELVHSCGLLAARRGRHRG